MENIGLLTLDSVLATARPSLQKKILYSIDLIRKSEKIALRLDPADGFYNTFSGGKDSQCLYHLVKLAGVKANTTWFSSRTQVAISVKSGSRTGMSGMSRIAPYSMMAKVKTGILSTLN